MLTTEEASERLRSTFQKSYKARATEGQVQSPPKCVYMEGCVGKLLVLWVGLRPSAKGEQQKD